MLLKDFIDQQCWRPSLLGKKICSGKYLLDNKFCKMCCYYTESCPPFLNLHTEIFKSSFPQFKHNHFRNQCICSHSLKPGGERSKFPHVAFRSVAACWPVYQWGCPDPTGSHLLDCPRPRECGGPRWGPEARPQSFQSQSSRLLFCPSSRVQIVGNCPQPAGKWL